MKRIILAFFLYSVLLLPQLAAQDIPQSPNVKDEFGQKQGKWTICYDAQWVIIEDCQEAVYYRLVTYLNDQAIGKVGDYYASGKPQMLADSIFSEKPETYQGQATFYRADGSKEFTQKYEQGKLIDEVYYDEKGQILEESWAQINKMGIRAFQSNAYDQALVFWKKGEKLALKEFGKEHPNYATALANLSFILERTGKYQKAEPLALQAKAIREKVLGKDHPEYALSLNNLGVLYRHMGKYQEALAFSEEARAIREQVLGRQHQDHISSLNNLATLHTDMGDFIKAQKIYRELESIYENGSGIKSPNYTYFLLNFG
ncbi:MAG: tetratricopeptide repeat protein, partial [Bacteroidota bacterium]